MGNMIAKSDIDSVLIVCEIDQSEAIAFIQRCQEEGVSCSEKIETMVENFLVIGDNHLLKTA